MSIPIVFDKEPEEEEIEVTEATTVETPLAEPSAITTVYGETQSEGTAQLKIMRRMYNQIEDALNRIDRQEQEHQFENNWMQLKNDPTRSTDMAFQILENRVMNARMIYRANKYTLEGIKQELDTLQRMMRER